MNTCDSSWSVVGEILGMIVGTVVLVWVIPMFGFVLPTYLFWLPIGVATTVIGGGLKIIAKLVDGRIGTACELMATGFGLYSTYVLYRISPFDFGLVGWDMMQQLFPISLIMVMMVMVVVMLVQMVLLLVGQSRA